MIIREIAEKQYQQQTKWAERLSAKKGVARQELDGIIGASIDEIEQHIKNTQHFGLNWQVVRFGITYEEMDRIATPAQRRRAGVRALINRHGHAGAAQIVEYHTGRAIR